MYLISPMKEQITSGNFFDLAKALLIDIIRSSKSIFNNNLLTLIDFCLKCLIT